MSCKCATFDSDIGRYECSVTGDQCMYLYPDSKRCAEEYGEGPDVVDVEDKMSDNTIRVGEPPKVYERKMTPEEAVRAIKISIFYETEERKKTVFSKALDVAVEALEKQIPKKPDLEGDGYDECGYMIYDTWICPNCEKHYEVDYDNYDFCPSCGQALDRSEINE